MRKMYILLIVVILASCTTTKRFTLAPEYFEDNEVKIEYRIGKAVYFIKIYNKTESEIIVDSSGVSIISIKDEARAINPLGSTNRIPPKSYIIMHSSQNPLFESDINKPFETSGLTTSSAEIKLDDFIGQSLRLFIPIVIEDKIVPYNIKLKIDGVYDNGTGLLNIF